jgi:alcohol dehydrogenase (NADP+)
MVVSGVGSAHPAAAMAAEPEGRKSFDRTLLKEKVATSGALDEINRIQTRQRLNDVVNTGTPGFIPRVRST